MVDDINSSSFYCQIESSVSSLKKATDFRSDDGPDMSNACRTDIPNLHFGRPTEHRPQTPPPARRGEWHGGGAARMSGIIGHAK